MNSVHSQNIEAGANSKDLARTLKLMENAGAPWEDRAAVAIDFLEAKKNNSGSKSPRCERTVADEELTFDDDPITSDCDPTASDCDANTSEPNASASDSDANPSAQTSEQVPEPEPELPPPPKFQFGVGNPLYEPALDFRAFRDKRSILDRLTDTQRQAIFKLTEHYTEPEIVDLLAKAPPAGLSIRVSCAAINRFTRRYQKQERRRNRINFMRELDRLLTAADGNDQAFLKASERMLKMRLFEITGDPNANLETVAKLTGVITTLRKQALAERKLKKSKSKPEPRASDEPIPSPQQQPQPPDP